MAGFTRIPGPNDWERFNIYANRVKSLVHTHTELRNVEQKFLSELSLYRRTVNILPNLRFLSWRDPRPDHFPYISLFMGPSLRVVDTRVFSDEMLINFWDLLGGTVPTIQKVIMLATRSEISDLASGSQLEALSSLTGLKELRTCELITSHDGVEISARTLACLSNIPTLQTLKVRLRGGPIPAEPRTPVVAPNDQFSSLRTVEVHIPDSGAMDTLVSFLTNYQLPYITQVTVCTRWQPPATQLRVLFEALSEKTQLRSISIYLFTEENLACTDPPYVVTESTIRQLFTLPLSRFNIFGFPNDIDKTTVVKMAKSWPDLTVLSVSLPTWRHFQPPPPTLHVQDLEILASGCPLLTQITLNLAMEVTHCVEAGVPVRNARQPSNGRVNLNIGLPNLPKAVGQVKIAAFLTGLFANIRVSPYKTYRGGGSHSMDDFLKVVETLNKCRAQERLM